MTTESRAPLTVFLGLTFGLSSVFWWLIVAAGSLRAEGALYLFALMWCPGVSAIATRLLIRRGGTRGGPLADVAQWVGVAYVLPLGYAAAGYGAVWIAGLGAVDVSRFQGSILGFLVVGFLQSLLTATGEELGWRGFLVPAARVTQLVRPGVLRRRHRRHWLDAMADRRIRCVAGRGARFDWLVVLAPAATRRGQVCGRDPRGAVVGCSGGAVIL